MTDNDLTHMLRICRAARDGGYGVLSTGEKLAAALVLNRHDWLTATGYTIVEAIDRIGPEWVSKLRTVERLMSDDERGLLCSDRT